MILYSQIDLLFQNAPDMIGSDHVVKNAQIKALSGFKKPIDPSSSITGKL
jgi:hypothetical protein